MGKIILSQRKGKIGVYKRSNKKNIGSTSYRNYDILEKKASILGFVENLVISKSSHKPVAIIRFENRFLKKTFYELFVAVEGIYIGQYISCGIKSKLNLGNVVPVGHVLPGLFVSNIEEKPGDCGSLAKSSGAFAGILNHNSSLVTTKIRLPSKNTKTVSSLCRATIGIVAGSGRVDKPLLKAGASFFKFKNSRKKYYRVRGVAQNPVDHPHGGGNHQHIGFPSTISKRSSPGQKVGLIGARKTGIKSKIRSRKNI
mmetsp:Transcript_7909/g.11907  ORF Transcript_7909/g.11907 Transcript_7909/m.11907 type:complete len:256 (+) Transcript_7909:45-812(+)